MPDMNKPKPGKPGRPGPMPPISKPPMRPMPLPMPPMTKPMPRPPIPTSPGNPGSPGIMPTPVRPGNDVMENMPIVRDDMGGNGFTPYAAGKKHYGTGRGAPNVGATGNMAGYAMRDGKAAARRQALMRRTGGK
jgi:hypothetical protein